MYIWCEYEKNQLKTGADKKNTIGPLVATECPKTDWPLDLSTRNIRPEIEKDWTVIVSGDTLMWNRT